MDSIWSESVKLPEFCRLEGDTKTDVLIVGGGIAGILCAYLLKQQGVDYILAEGRTICSGVTKNTTAKITAQHGLIYQRLLKSLGAERTAMYLEANQNAVKKYFELCGGMDCDFEQKNNYVYSMDDRRKIEREAEALHRIGFQPVVTGAKELPFAAAGAVGFPCQAQFHPLKFIAAIAGDLKIYEHTFVKEFGDHTAVTENGRIAYKKLIFATHFPIDNKHGMYFLKLYQHRSYVIALRNAAKIDGMYVDESKKGLSFRNYGDCLLLGGGGHRTGKAGGCFQELRNAALKYYPGSDETACWAAQDCMSLDQIPYIGRYSKSKNMQDCYVASGFNKWGMTSAMTAAMLLTDLIMERENPAAAVFDPSRNMLKPQLLVNGCEAAANLLTISKKRCPHLGCALKWNEAEHSWDCPCHGSRFDEEGRLLDNPANGDLPQTKQ